MTSAILRTGGGSDIIMGLSAHWNSIATKSKYCTATIQIFLRNVVQYLITWTGSCATFCGIQLSTKSSDCLTGRKQDSSLILVTTSYGGPLSRPGREMSGLRCLMIEIHKCASLFMQTKCRYKYLWSSKKDSEIKSVDWLPSGTSDCRVF
jgi:hypothetical protein